MRDRRDSAGRFSLLFYADKRSFTLNRKTDREKGLVLL